MKKRTILASAGIVGKIALLCFVAIAAVPGGSAAFALDLMGPPRATVEQGQIGTGADFSLGEMDIELKNGKWVENQAGVFQDAGNAIDISLGDFETMELYGSIGYGIAENWEAFLRIGAKKAGFGDSIWAQGEDFDSGIDFAVGGGVRATLFEIGDLEIGGLFQANWCNLDGKLDASHWPSPVFVEVDLIEMQIALGATYPWTDSVSVYGGPFVHYIQGDFETQFTNFDITWDIDEGPNYGGYLGAVVEIAENCFFNVEYQHSADASAFAAGLMFRN